MTKTTLICAETTDLISKKCALSDILESTKVKGSVLVNEEYVAPWRVSIPNTGNLKTLLQLNKSTHPVAFHYVKRGFIEISSDFCDSVLVEAGELAICFGGVQHEISQYSEADAVPVETILLNGNNPFAPDEKSKAKSTSVLCGVFMMKNKGKIFATLKTKQQTSAHRVHYDELGKFQQDIFDRTN